MPEQLGTRARWRGALLVWALPLLSCARLQGQVIEATLIDVPAAATTITVRATLDGRDGAVPSADFVTPAPSVSVVIEPPQRGHVVLTVSARRDVTVCAHGTAETDLTSAAVVTVTVTLKSTGACPDTGVDGGTDGGAPAIVDPDCATTLCWQSPLPQGNTLNRLFGLDANNIWAVGDLGTIIHWNGATWSRSTSGTTAHLRGVWGASANNVFAAGDGGIIQRWDGTQWAPFKSPANLNLNGMWGTSGSNIWAVGRADSVAGSRATIIHYDGVSWTSFGGAQPATADLNAVSLSAAGPTLAVGNNGASLQLTGSSWQNIGNNATAAVLRDVWSSSDSWVAGSDGARHVVSVGGMLQLDMPAGLPGLYGVYGTAASDIWFVGEGGLIEKLSGAAPATVSSPTKLQLRSVWSQSLNDPLWAAGRGGVLLRGDRTAPTSVSWSVWNNQQTPTLRAIWGRVATDLVAVGDGGALLRSTDGVRWTAAALPSAGGLNALGGVGFDVWAVGDAGAILHSKDSFSTSESQAVLGLSDSLRGVCAFSAKNAVVVGANNAIGRWDGVTWKRVSWISSGGVKVLSAVACASSGEAWIVGVGGLLVRLNPDDTVTEIGVLASGKDLRGVWVAPGGDVWMVGESYIVRRRTDGSVDSFLAASFSLNAVTGGGPSGIVAVGNGGLVLRFGLNLTASTDPSSLVVRSVTNNNLNAVFVAPSGDTWVAGEFASILHARPPVSL